MIRLPPASPLFPYTTLFRSESVGRLPYLQAVISETLRIEPIVSDVPRVCKSVLSVGEWTVPAGRSEEHTSELQSLRHLVCRLLLEKKKQSRTRHGRDNAIRR